MGRITLRCESGLKILLFGADGQVGWELRRSLAPLGELVALEVDSRNELTGNLANLDGIKSTIRAVAPDVIVNAAAHTQVDRAEAEEDVAATINAEAPAVMAKEASKLGALLLQYSTDYVFSGEGSRPWSEDDVPNPLSVYARTKLAGENAIRASGCRHIIFRTSWVYAARGSNFIASILRLASERERLTVVNDQFGAPTGAELLADVTALTIRETMSRPDLEGLYHVAASGETSWHQYAEFIVDRAAEAGVPLKTKEVAPISSSEFPTPAKRPFNSRLDTRKVQAIFGVRLPDWRDGVSRVLTEIFEGRR